MVGNYAVWKKFWENGKPKIDIRNAQGTTIIENNDVVENSLTINRYASNSDRLEFGSTIAAELSLSLDNTSGKWDEVVTTGKNIAPRVNTFSNGVMVAATEEGYKFSGYPDEYITRFTVGTVSFPSAGKYTVSCTENGRIEWQLEDPNGGVLYFDGATARTITVSVLTGWTLKVVITGSNYLDATIPFQIEAGTSATSFEPVKDISLFTGQELYAWVWAGDETVAIPMGVYRVDELKRGSFIHIKALDRMCDLDEIASDDFVSVLESASADEYINVYYALVRVLQHLGLWNGFTDVKGDISLASVSFNYVEMAKYKFTWRQFIGWCAGLCGECAYFNRLGNLQFNWYNDSDVYYTSAIADIAVAGVAIVGDSRQGNAQLTMGKDKVYSSEFGETDRIIGGVSLIANGDEVYAKSTIPIGSCDYYLSVGDNLLLNGCYEYDPEATKAIIDTICDNRFINKYNNTDCIVYRPCNLTTIRMPFIDLFDAVIYPKGHSYHKCYVTDWTWSLGGATAIGCRGINLSESYDDERISGLQTQLNGKQNAITGAVTSVLDNDLSANRVVVTDSNGKIAASALVDTTELGFLNGVTSNIQTQLNGKASTSVATTSANGLMSSTDKTKLNAVGKIYSDSQTVNITDVSDIDKFTLGAHITLPAGTYVIAAEWQFPTVSNENGRVLNLDISPTSSLTNGGDRYARERIVSGWNNWACLNVTTIVALASNTTVYAKGSTNIAVNSCTSKIWAVRIA